MMAVQADNQTDPRHTFEVVDDDFTVKLIGIETTRQYRFNKATTLKDKDETQCPMLLSLRGPMTIRGRNEAYKVEIGQRKSS